MAPGIVVISGQAALISSMVKINLLSLSASSENFDNCRTNLLQEEEFPFYTGKPRQPC